MELIRTFAGETSEAPDTMQSPMFVRTFEDFDENEVNLLAQQKHAEITVASLASSMIALH